MIRVDLQFYGGRGTGSSGSGKMSYSGGKWSGNVGEAAHDTLKEALGKKGSPKSIGDATVGTNPNYNGDYKEYSENCQRCVVAYEARRRGYDVTAQPTYQGDTLNQIAYNDQKAGVIRGRWMGAFQDAKPVSVGSSTESGVIKNIDSKMSSYGDGSRGVVQIFYKGGGGHVFNVENQKGRTVFVEAQTGRIKDFKKTLSHVKTDSVVLVRTDNLKLSDRAKKFVTPVKK